MSNIWALDLETAPAEVTNRPYALEPFRYKQGRAKITSVAISGPEYIKSITNMEELNDTLPFLAGKVVYAHNAVFDIAWLLAVNDKFDVLNRIEWRDTSLLAKWIVNSQAVEYNVKGKFSYSLVNLCKTFLKTHPRLSEFIKMKNEDFAAGENENYWLERGNLDAIMTRDLAIELERLLPKEQRRGYLIEQKCLTYVARAWILGIPFDVSEVNKLRPKVATMKDKISSVLGVEGALIKSPKQLSNYLFITLGMDPINKTKTGQGSTAAGDLKMLMLRYAGTSVGKRLKMILQYKKLATLESKYLNGFEDVYEYVGEPVCYAQPRLFSTYTGRFTYSSKTTKKGSFKTSIALHQIPRKGPVKKCLVARPGEILLLNDASQQELRLIGQVSQDEGLISEFNSGIDVHSSMSAYIAGEEYTDFCKKLAKGDEAAKNVRYAGKLLNLSCQYRIGSNSLKRKFFETYDLNISQQTAQTYLGFYKRRYPGVVKYWKDVIVKSREKGFTESLGNRRYAISQWSLKQWQSESSAINFPIQGSAADHKLAMIYTVSEKFPEITFSLDIHDEAIFNAPDNRDELYKEVIDFTNKIDYGGMWDKKLSLQLPFDSMKGYNFADKSEVK